MEYWKFSQLIINWYHQHGRNNLPWQIKKTPYNIWVSEIMLQQTQVKTVIPYFKRFISKLHNIHILASTSLDEILHLWSGLGYYKRAINLHKTSKIIVKQYNGKIPDNIIELIKLPGIGRTTAGAILSLSKDFSFPILDGNVKRILIRFYNILKNSRNKIDTNKLWYLINMITPLHHASKFNQGMMDLGSLICRYKTPKCKICPLYINCQYIKNMSQKNIINNKKIKKEKQYFYIIVQYKYFIFLECRKNKKIWKNLFCFPEFKNEENMNNWLLINNIDSINNQKINLIYHKLSHLILKMHIFKISIQNNKIFSKNKNYIWYNLNNPQRIGISKPIKTILLTL
ncbi:Adenine DNA glycosylase [Buchnera aphidicola (Phyllaphis fagi)]|uniref:A/G-specific adenine glycosylase n=1 Tax=Buchnera aphidicola TaxID=9 RepID=UPI003463FF8F